MAAKPLPTPEVVRNLIDYDPKTGRMFWKVRSRDMFKTDRDWRWWNSRYAGTETGTFLTPDGYRQVKLFNRAIHAHRIAWAIVYGVWPPQVVDHKNGKRSDNRIKNLRSCSRKANQRNQKIHSSNTSGHTGVYWNRFTNKWVAQIGANDRTHYLGSFDEKHDAITKRREAERRFCFDKSHGVRQ